MGDSLGTFENPFDGMPIKRAIEGKYQSYFNDGDVTPDGFKVGPRTVYVELIDPSDLKAMIESVRNVHDLMTNSGKDVVVMKISGVASDKFMDGDGNEVSLDEATKGLSNYIRDYGFNILLLPVSDPNMQQALKQSELVQDMNRKRQADVSVDIPPMVSFDVETAQMFANISSATAFEMRGELYSVYLAAISNPQINLKAYAELEKAARLKFLRDVSQKFNSGN